MELASYSLNVYIVCDICSCRVLFQSAFSAISPEDLPRATFAKTIESIVEPLFSPAHFPAQKTSSAVWVLFAFRLHISAKK